MFFENKDQFKVWVFAPYLETDDPNLQYYCDYTQSIAEYTRVFEELGCAWEWVNIAMEHISREIERVAQQTALKNIVLNLCDGDEINGVPGVSVIHALEAANLPYTGANDFFYEISTSKITLKEAFDRRQVATPEWIRLDAAGAEQVFEMVGTPVIVKPAVSAGSLGVGIRNVVDTLSGLEAVLNDMGKGYRGWNLHGSGLVAERYIAGREFTVLIVGSCTLPEAIKMYDPVERVFHQSLPENEQFLSFDRLWETYDEESPMPDGGAFYEYAAVESPELRETLADLSLRAYHAVGGMGYGRLDIRQDKNTRKLYVLEVNAQCALSDDENHSSIGAILRFSRATFTSLILEILEDALRRHTTPALT